MISSTSNSAPTAGKPTIYFNAAALDCYMEPMFLTEQCGPSCIERVENWVAQQPVHVQAHIDSTVVAIYHIGEHYWQPESVDFVCIRELAMRDVRLSSPEEFDDYKQLLAVSEQGFLIGLTLDGRDFGSSRRRWTQLVTAAHGLARNRADRVAVEATIAADNPIEAVKAWLRKQAPLLAAADNDKLMDVAAWLVDAREQLSAPTFDWLMRQPVKFVDALRGDRDPNGLLCGACFCSDRIMDSAGGSDHLRIIETLRRLAALDVQVPDLDYFLAANRVLCRAGHPLLNLSVQHCKTTDSLVAFQRFSASLMERDAGMAAMLSQCGDKAWDARLISIMGTAAHLIAGE